MKNNRNKLLLIKRMLSYAVLDLISYSFSFLKKIEAYNLIQLISFVSKSPQ